MNGAIVVSVSLPRATAKQLDQLARHESMTRSEFVRSMIRREVAWQQLDQFQQKTRAAGKRASIQTLADAVRIVRAER
jgi:metal-responsive CopG/Arc/MetJ family transcriptional regulator